MLRTISVFTQIFLFLTIATTILLENGLYLISLFFLGAFQVINALVELALILNRSLQGQKRLFGYIGMVAFWALMFLLPINSGDLLKVLWMIVVPCAIGLYFLWMQWSFKKDTTEKKTAFLPNLDFQ